MPNVRKKDFIAAYTTRFPEGYIWACMNIDYQNYPVSIDGLGRIYAKVPAEDARFSSRDIGTRFKLVPQYGVIDNQLALLSCEFKLGDKVYQVGIQLF